MKVITCQLVLLAFLLIPVKATWAHCEVPCGVYGDERRFAHMLEDHETIRKAIDQIVELAGTHDPDETNQMVRWITTKEAHATSIQHTIAQYFMTQRIKSDQPDYNAKLTSAHAVMVAAMKCKQAADPETAGALEEAIKAFQKAYEGK